MRRAMPGGALAVAVVASFAAPVQAPPPDLPPTVTVAAPARLTEGPDAPCSDAYGVGVGLLTFPYEDADGAPDGSPTPQLQLEIDGDAVPDVDYGALPSTTPLHDQLRLEMRAGDEPAGSTRTLTVTLLPGDGYLVGDPSTVSIELVHRDRRCAPPTFGPAPTNTVQTIAVGEVPVPLELVDPMNGSAFAALLGGQLPPGVGLDDDGSFFGAARTAGTFVATVGSCRGAYTTPPGLCTGNELTVTVVGTSLPAPAPACAVDPLGAVTAAPDSGVAIDSAGRFVVFDGIADDGRRGVLLHDTTTRRMELLPDPTGRHDPVRDNARVAISSTGRTIAYALDLGTSTNPSTAIVMRDVATGRTRLVTEVYGYLSGLQVSDDGRHVYAIGPQPGTAFESEAREYDTTTGAERVLALGPSSLDDLSPDGTTLLGYTRTGSGLAIDVRAGASGPVTLPGAGFLPGFAPTGAGVLLARLDDPPPRLERIDLGTGAITSVAALNGLVPVVYGPIVPLSPSSRAFGFSSVADSFGENSDGNAEAVVGVIGGSQTQVTDTSGPGGVTVAAVDDAARTVVLLAPGQLDSTGSGALPRSFERQVHVARCGATALARTG